MSIKVTVVSPSKNRISINNQSRSTVRAVGIVADNINFLNELKDVDASDPDNNETLVYDESTGKYVVKTLPIINGGTY